MTCPQCNTELQAQNINIQTDVAQCQNCNYVFRVSESLEERAAAGFDVNNPPKGAWIKREIDQIVIGATTRSPAAFFLAPFTVVWSGFSIGGIYGRQLASGEFDLFSSLFGIPFLIGSVALCASCLMAIWGKVELTLDKDGGTAFTGLGDIGWSKDFEWNEVSTIKEQRSEFRYPGYLGSAILVEGKSRISFGTGLIDSRRYYLYKALKSILLKTKGNGKFI